MRLNGLCVLSRNIADSLTSGFALGPFNDMSMIVWTYDGVVGNDVVRGVLYNHL
jgi:hypothetical protein